MNENHIGSDFDDFLSEEGLLEEAEATAVKRVLAYQISQLMEAQNISKTEMARRMQTSRAALELRACDFSGLCECWHRRTAFPYENHRNLSDRSWHICRASRSGKSRLVDG